MRNLAHLHGRRRRLVLLGGLLAAAGLAGACNCKGKQPDGGPAAAPDRPTALRFLPPRPQGLVIVSDLQKLGATLAELQKTKLAELAAAAQGEQDADELVRPLVQQLGFDPRTPDGFVQAGVDGTKGVAFGQDEQGAQLLVIGVADAGKFDAYVAALAQRMGSTGRGEAPLTGGTAKAKTFSGGEGEAAQVGLAYALADGFAIVAVEAGAVAAVDRALARPKEQSLAKSPELQTLQAKLGPRDAIVWLPPGAHLGRRKAPENGLALGIRAARSGINARALLPQGAVEMAVLAPARVPAGGELVAKLPPDSAVAFRLGGEPTALRPLLDGLLSKRLKKRLEKAGFDLDRDILGILKPGLVVGVALAKDINLSGGLPGEASVSSFNPFQFVSMTLYGRVKDPAVAQGVLDRLAGQGEAFRMAVATKEEAGAKVYTASYSQGEGMTWGLVGDMLVATGGKGQFALARARVAKQEPPFALADPAAKQAFETAASAGYLDVPRLAAALRAIPESSYGIGGFRLKEIVETWVQMLDEVKGVTASFSLDDQGLVVDADLPLK